MQVEGERRLEHDQAQNTRVVVCLRTCSNARDISFACHCYHRLRGPVEEDYSRL